MATDWASRLDAKGYHILPAKRPNLHARWASETEVEVDEKGGRWILGDAIEVAQDAEFTSTFRVAKGDVVYLTGMQKSKPAEIQLVEEIFQDARPKSRKKDTFWFSSVAFWRPERLRFTDDSAYHVKELFLAWDSSGRLPAGATVESLGTAPALRKLLGSPSLSI